jgi:hypothetical protein
MNHKSDDGGVAIRLGDRAAVEVAAEMFKGIAVRKKLAATSVLVQKMSQGVEILVGIKRDPSFGLVLVVGSAARWRNCMRRSQPLFYLPHLLCSADFVAKRSFEHAARGLSRQPAADRDALVAFLADFGDWALGQREALAEVDLNPVMVSGGWYRSSMARAVWN